MQYIRKHVWQKIKGKKDPMQPGDHNSFSLFPCLAEIGEAL
jgi:hypothetical protein